MEYLLQRAEGSAPHVVLNVEYHDRNDYKLIIRQLHPDLCTFMEISSENHVGKTPYDLFAEDRLCVDDWYEFVLRCTISPAISGGIETDSGYAWGALQFFDSKSLWRETLLFYRPSQNVIEIRFLEPEEQNMLVPTERVMILKQWRSLADHAANAGTFLLDAASEMVYFSSALSALLHIGDQPTVYNLRDVCKMLLPDDLNRMESWVRGLAAGTRQNSITCRLYNASSQMVYIKIFAYATHDATGRYSGLVGRGEDITEGQMAAEAYAYLKIHDGLTDVFNRSYLEDLLNELSRQGDEGVGICVCDINGLRLINDGFGHEAGNSVLVRLANLLRREMPANTSICRVGGGEFAVVFHQTNHDELESSVKALTRAVADSVAIPPLTIAAGCSMWKSTDTSSMSVYNRAEERMFANKLLQTESSRGRIIHSLKETLRARNLETVNHTERMERMARMLGEKLGLTPAECTQLELLASMHDIGKVAIPDAVINKNGGLDDEEWETMRTHAEIGARIAMSSGELAGIAKEIACHHERWDGSGYPFGYQRQEIPMLSRIISVVDAYDVMTHQRNYKNQAKTHHEAVAELRRCAGSQFDPAIVEVFLNIFSDYSDAEMHGIFDQPQAAVLG